MKANNKADAYLHPHICTETNTFSVMGKNGIYSHWVAKNLPWAGLVESV